MNIEQAKSIELTDYLHSIGCVPIKQQGVSLWYLSPLRAESEPSFKINLNRNEWYDFGAGVGGDIIRLVMNTSTDNIRAILESDFSERVNPVHQYFEQLPRTQGTQVIERLAATVTVQNPTHWVEYLTKWLVVVAANALNDDDCQNHVCLVLTGEQGAFKTSWLNRLCPKSLKTYERDKKHKYSGVPCQAGDFAKTRTSELRNVFIAISCGDRSELQGGLF